MMHLYRPPSRSSLPSAITLASLIRRWTGQSWKPSKRFCDTTSGKISLTRFVKTEGSKAKKISATALAAVISANTHTAIVSRRIPRRIASDPVAPSFMESLAFGLGST
jgi:hypothetical protein